MKTVHWLLNRLAEPSTWRGLIQIGAGLGIFALSPSQEVAILGGGTALAGIINAFKKDAASPDAK